MSVEGKIVLNQMGLYEGMDWIHEARNRGDK
jgi:hypothetical protein